MNYYQRTTDESLTSLDTSLDGLSEAEVTQRKEKFGLNQLQTEVKINKWKLFINQFRSFIVYIMLFAVVLSFFLQEYADATVITLILIANALIGYYQELGAQKSLEALKKLSVVNAKVRRNNKVIQLDSSELVPGDIISLEAGDKVPADARVLEASSLKLEEASLTGESLPVEKNIAAIKENVEIGNQLNMLFSSTTVLGGSAKALVVKTGMDTEIGKITELVKDAEEQLTPLQIRLDKFGQKLGIAVIIICITVFAVMAVKSYLQEGFTNEVLLAIFLIAVALAVAAVPSGLPAVVTIALSIGVKKLLKKKALVRKLASVETLGSCNIICSDKTGTLTQNQMTVRRAWTFQGEAQIEGVGYQPEGTVKGETTDLLFQIGEQCNNASVYLKEGEWQISGDPTEVALLVSADKANTQKIVFQRKAELPFESDRKRMSVWVEHSGSSSQMFTKGAPDQMLEVCNFVYKEGKIEAMSEDDTQKISKQIDDYSRQAFRVLAFAYKDIQSESEFTEDKLVFVGLQAIIDPPRPDVIESVKRTKEAGIRLIMITGDHKETAKAIGKEIGIEGNVLTGAELSEMSDGELEEKLNDDTNVFARVIPEHKQRIVTALQHQGNVVAMTGDGVNDAPALKKANIGIAVGSGTDVAKEASDFILIDDSFTNIVNAIEEGRGIYDNIQKAIMHLLSGNLSEVLIIFLAVLFGWDLPMTAIMLLWVNLMTDGAPALALGVDPYGDNIMQRKPFSLDSSILPKPQLTLITIMGIYATIIALGLFYMSGGTDGDLMQAQTMTFCFVVISESVLLLSIRYYFKIPFFTNSWLWGAILGGFGLQGLLLYTPLSEIFGCTALNLTQIGVLLASGTVLYLLSATTAYVIRTKYQLAE